MVNIKKTLKKEKGQAMVEYAFIIPIFLMLLLVTIDFGWIIYQKNMFDYTCRHSAWEMDLESFDEYSLNTQLKIHLTGWEANQFLEDYFRIVNRNTLGHLDTRNVRFKNSEIFIYPGVTKYKYKKPEDLPEYAASDLNLDYKNTTIEIRGEGSYKINTITPLSKPFLKDGITVKNSIHKILKSRKKAGNM